MNRNVFISFLGTSDYEPCRYLIEKREVQTEFVQVAITSHECKEWSKDDRLYFFVTKKAKSKNWHALSEAIHNCNLAPEIKAIEIPEETSEKTLWNIFEIIYQQLLEGDNLVLDITHGFRTSPLLLLTIINYSSFLKKTRVSKVYYGAFAARGTNNLDYTPIWDLTDLILLQEWTTAANEYIKFGDPEKLTSLARESAIPRIKDNSGKDSAIKVKGYAESVNKAAQLFTTVRSSSLYSNKIIQNVISSSGEVEKINFIVPMKSIMKETKKKYVSFNKEDMLNFLPSVDYCIRHGLIQQGLTFLQEGIVSYVLDRVGLKWCTNNKKEEEEVRKNRDMASSVLQYIEYKRNPKWHGNQWFKDERFKEMKIKIEEMKKDEFCYHTANIFVEITKYRNDINHGGYICPKSPDKFLEKLEKGYEQVKDNIRIYQKK